MNILHLTSILPAPISTKSRENNILLRLAKEYQKKYPESKHHFIYITPYSNWFFALLKKKWKEYLKIIKQGSFERDGFNITVIGIPGFKNDTRFRKVFALLGYRIFKKRISKKLQQVKPDLIHAHNMGSNLELAELIRNKFGVSYLVTARSINSLALSKIKKKLLRPTAVIAHSKFSASRCSDMAVPVNIIAHPVEDVFFTHENDLTVNDTSVLRLVSVCSLIKLKNLDKVLNAIKTVQTNLTYAVYGDGQEKENLMTLVRSLALEKNVSFKGHAPHTTLSRDLKEYDLFVMPSFPETLGRVYFEAMAAGLPVIASKNTGIDGMIEHKKEGYLVDHKNSSEIKEAILHFHSLPSENKEEMKRNAINFARQFTWDTVLEKYHNVYHQYSLSKKANK